jgi:hypothetical protein
MIRNTKALIAEEERTGDIPGTAGHPEAFHGSVVIFPDDAVNKHRRKIYRTRPRWMTCRDYPMHIRNKCGRESVFMER